MEGVGFRLYFGIDHPYNNSQEPRQIPLDPTGDFYDPTGHPVDLYTNSDGLISVDNLPPGPYFIKEFRPLANYEIINPVESFKILGFETVLIEVVNSSSGGGFNFRKISKDTSLGLEGAKFLVSVKNEDETFTRIQRDNEDLILTSDENGNFSVDKLPYGLYYLWDLQAPRGYRPLAHPISFEVGRNSRMQVLEIENDYGPPPPDTPTDDPKVPPEEAPGEPPSDRPSEPGDKPDHPGDTPDGTKKSPHNPSDRPKTPITIPKTGDITILIMVVSGFIMVATGGYLIKNSKEQEESNINWLSYKEASFNSNLKYLQSFCIP